MVLAPFFAHPFDVYSWYSIGENFLSGKETGWSFLVPYDYSFFLFVIPAALVFGFLSNYLGAQTISMSSLNPLLNPGAPWNISVVPGLLFDLLVKLPLIASDTLVAFLIYRIVKAQLKDDGLATTAAALWFLNPLTVWVSSGWGMFDTLPTLFTVLSLYFILKGKFAYSGLALVASIVLKYYAIVLAIPLLFIAWKEGGRRGLVIAMSSIVVASLFLFLPLLGEVIQGFGFLAAGTPQFGLSYAGLSFWSAITLFFAIPYLSTISSLLVVASLTGIYYWMVRKNSVDLFSLAAYFGLALIPLLLFFRFVGENYVVWIIPFVSILAIQTKRAKILLWSLSLVAFISSITDALLPYYMLPLAPWIGKYLVGLLSLTIPYRVAPGGAVTQTVSFGKLFLSGLGVLSAILLVLITITWIMAENRSD
ncbi:MAG: hypothetical protein JRN09_03535 [Nitrososphaerota archaeon]|nr:hypothetical protein [Nitrososphaerota archaeon]